jgi:hypothetical protein
VRTAPQQPAPGPSRAPTDHAVAPAAELGVLQAAKDLAAVCKPPVQQRRSIPRPAVPRPKVRAAPAAAAPWSPNRIALPKPLHTAPAPAAAHARLPPRVGPGP